jgi:hypothetical protein
VKENSLQFDMMVLELDPSNQGATSSLGGSNPAKSLTWWFMQSTFLNLLELLKIIQVQKKM